MSSLQRGAAGASKPKPVNVNSLYSGRNLSATGKPSGKHGLQSVGKCIGVVRRMPPPATLPSLKAENNGQDPTINIVPTTGSGWKDPASGDGSKVPQTTAGPDMRPTWAKPQNDAISQPTATTREFPTLSVSGQGKDAKLPNAWSAGAPAISGSQSARTASSTSGEEERQLPSRYYDVSPQKPATAQASLAYRPRFQGSNDARASQPGYFSKSTESRDSDRDRGNSISESTARSETDVDDCHSRDSKEASPPISGPTESSKSAPVDSETAPLKVPPKVNGSQQPLRDELPPRQEIRVLRRPERKLDLEDVSDEEVVHMTKINKPVRVMKRAAVEQGSKQENDNIDEPRAVPKKPVVSNSQVERAVASEPSSHTNSYSKPVNEKKASIAETEKKVEDSKTPAPTENIWAKRKEERESQEKEGTSISQAVIEQHFPAVGETVAMKVDKDLARRPVDTEFERSAMRARRQQQSNDVRKIMPRDRDRMDDRDRRQARDDYAEREMIGRYNRLTSGLDDYEYGLRKRGSGPGRGDREYQPRYRNDDRVPPRRHQEEEYQPDLEERIDAHHNRHYSARRGMVSRGRAIRGGGYSRGRGRVVYGGNQSPHPPPHFQIHRRSPVQKENPDDESHLQQESLDVEKVVSADPAPTTGENSVEFKEKQVRVMERSKEAKTNENCSMDSATDLTTKAVEDISLDDHVRKGRPSRGRGGRELRQRGDRRGRGVARDSQATRRSRPHNLDENHGHVDSEVHSAQNQFSSRGRGYQRSRRGTAGAKHRGARQPRVANDGVGSEKSDDHGVDRPDRLKSPVVSSEGHDEWETASESSARMNRERSEPLAEKRFESRKVSTRRDEKGAPLSAERLRSKNVQPARHTFQSPSDGSKQKNQERQQQLSPEQNSAADGLAGVDINNISGVVVIDDHLQEAVSPDAIAEFEEVMSKRAKKQKLLEMQQKLEAEERRKLKEKERSEKLQAKKALAKAKREKKQADPKEGKSKGCTEQHRENSSFKVGIDSGSVEKLDRKRPKDKIIPTTVWNSAHVAALEQREKEMDSNKAPSVIPSPIARPTPRSKSSASDTAPTKEEKLRMVELPVSLSSSQPLRDEKYDFTFDPHIHAAQRQQSEEKAAAASVSIASESGSVAEDVRLKEKLSQVKDIWGGEDKESAEGRLPSNVAKVKPQPQSSEQTTPDPAKSEAVVSSSQQITPRTSTMAPFSTSSFGSINFPTYLMPEGPQNGYPQPAGSLLPPPNAASPPNIPTYVQHHRPSQRNNFMDYMSQRSMTWTPNTLDGVMPFGSTPPPPSVVQHQPQSSNQFNFTNGPPRGNLNGQQVQGNLGNHRNFSGTNGQQKMNSGGPSHVMSYGHGGPLVTFDHMGMNVPPPHSIPGQHQQLGPVGSHRTDRNTAPYPMVANSYGHQPPPPPHFNQPPPNMNIRMQYSHPPPSFGPDWGKSGHSHAQQPPFAGNMMYRGQHNQMPLSRPGAAPQPPADVWSTPMQQFVVPSGIQMQQQTRSTGGFNNGYKGRGGHSHHSDRIEMKRPVSSSSQQQANGTSA